MPDLRLAALRRFALAITILTLAGHGFLGFEQAPAHVFTAIVTAYGLELLLEWVSALANGKTPRFIGGFKTLVDFMLPAHITALACAMLLYSNEQLLPVAFATAVAIGSKHLLRAQVGHGTRHFLNPSNTGITAVLLLFPWVGIAPPYHFTENVSGIWDWVIPGIIVCTGSLLNWRLTRRICLIGAWLATFAAQALVRHLLFGTPLVAGLVPMSGLAFLLFTFYMVSDPATTPDHPRQQLVFGAAVAIVYGILVSLHVVFGLFFALTVVCAVRGLYLYWASRRVTITADARALAGREQES